jgi:hypothetical protein
MLLDRSKIPSSINTHEKLIVWAGLTMRFNLKGSSNILTFQRSATDEVPTRLCDAGVFQDAAGVDRVGVLVYPSLNSNWMGGSGNLKPWEYVEALSTSAQAAMFDA